MGVTDRRPPPLPAPTETSSDNFGGNTTSAEDLATDVSRRTDFTSQTIPEDGSPIVISTSKKGHRSTGHPKPDASQTSLLIEYFEAGKTGEKVRARPSVRVRVTPSRRKEGREGSDSIQITETGKNRKPSYTRRISLGSKREESIPLAAGTSNLSYSTGSNLTGPVEVEVLPSASELSHSDVAVNYPYPSLVQGSEISSMPADSTLEGDLRIHTPPRTRSPLIEEPTSSPATLKAPERERSLSREREITHRVMEKIAQREASGKHSPSSKRVSSREYVPASPSSGRAPSERSRTRDSLQETSSLNPSDISRRTDRSARSGTSNVSINNPKLLATVEDAIRRLILPEIDAVKEEQRLQRNRSQYDSTTRGERTTSRSEDGFERRMSKSSSAPDVKGARPKITVTEDRDELVPGKLRKERRPSRDSDRSERSRQASSETVIKGEDKLRSRKSKDRSLLKDAALVGGAGVLTAAALKHHDSMSSVESGERERRRRKRRSKSRSRTASISEEAEHYEEHKESIPPLPMMPSEIGTDMTRDSIRSAETEMQSSRDSRNVLTPRKQFEVRQVSRGSPREVPADASPTTPTRTPTRTPVTLQRGLGAFHNNTSGTNLSLPAQNQERSYQTQERSYPTQERSHQSQERNYRDNLAPAAGAAAAALGGPAVMSSLQDISGLHESMSANTLDHYTPQRPLSPIQSVSSYRDSTIEPMQHSRVQSIKSETSLRSPEKRRSRAISTRSGESYDSAESFAFAKNRPAGISLERGYEILPENEYEPETPTSAIGDEGETPRAADVDDWFEKEHESNERYRHEFEDESRLPEESTRESGSDFNRLSTFTNSTGPYLDKVTVGQGLQRVGDNVEYVSTPVAVESAVASLHDPSSLLSSQSAHSSQNSPVKEETPRSNGSFAERQAEKLQQAEPLGVQDNSSRERWAAIREQSRSLSGHSHPMQQFERSPQQSPALSETSQPVKLSSSALPIAGQDLPAMMHGIDEEEMETNPSIIRGPMAGYPHGDRSHWPYDPTPPITGQDLIRPESQADEIEDHGHDAELGAVAGAGLAATGLGLAMQGTGKQINRSQRDVPSYKQARVDDQYEIDDEAEREFDGGQGTFAVPQLQPSSPAYLKDEGYMSSAQRDYTPDPYEDREVEDPFRSKRQAKHLSGMSHGMESPIYDSATGKGMDRIQSKDVVALMDHLTVRDSQRNARDTEIMVSLVRTAAEMRNSFEEMKEFIRTQDRMIVQNADRNADGVVQKVLGGPRPQPSASPRATRNGPSSEDGDNAAAARKQNFVKRALKGLSMRSTNDLGNIESMLMQLLNEVEGLRETQVRQNTAPPSVNSTEYLRQQPDPGYEPEGQAGTSSNPSQSGFLSNTSSRQLNGMQPMHSGFDGRRASGHRISTVDERDEDEYNDDSQYVDDGRATPTQEDRMTTPTQEARRSTSIPLKSPPQQHVNFRDSSEIEQTPKTKSSKHKSQGSSVFGNFANKVSRWSKTTTGTEASNRLSTERQQRPYSDASRSGSNLNVNQYGDQYPLNEDDRIRSQNSLAREQQQYDREDGQARAASPLIPDGASGASFDRPTYEAHRNSLNLQHPQPRPGPTGRHQDNLESRAQTYYDGLLPEEMEATWGSNPSLNLNRNINRLSASTGGNLSPVYSDNASVHSASEQTMQQHNPPPRPPKIRDDGPLVPNQQQPQQAQTLNSSGGSSSQYYATPLEPIEEARYSLETDRTRHLTPSPNPQAQPQAMQNSQRRITPAGPRAMSSSRSPSAAQQPSSPSDDVAIRRKPVSVRSAASSSLLSYRSSLDEDNEMF